MARVDVVMPKMGESIMEGTVIEWTKKVGDTVELDETLLEIATDKVDSEVPSPAAGVLVEINAEPNQTVEVGQVIAVIETDVASAKSDVKSAKQDESAPAPVAEAPAPVVEAAAPSTENRQPTTENSSDRFYSPLVLSIAKEENISRAELDKIEGTGAQGRVSKQDVMDYLEKKGTTSVSSLTPDAGRLTQDAPTPSLSKPVGSVPPTPTATSTRIRRSPPG